MALDPEGPTYKVIHVHSDKPPAKSHKILPQGWLTQRTYCIEIRPYSVRLPDQPTEYNHRYPDLTAHTKASVSATIDYMENN